jgi:hypothetical protein
LSGDTNSEEVEEGEQEGEGGEGEEGGGGSEKCGEKLTVEKTSSRPP